MRRIEFPSFVTDFDFHAVAQPDAFFIVDSAPVDLTYCTTFAIANSHRDFGTHGDSYSRSNSNRDRHE